MLPNCRVNCRNFQQNLWDFCLNLSWLFIAVSQAYLINLHAKHVIKITALHRCHYVKQVEEIKEEEKTGKFNFTYTNKQMAKHDHENRQADRECTGNKSKEHHLGVQACTNSPFQCPAGQGMRCCIDNVFDERSTLSAARQAAHTHTARQLYKTGDIRTLIVKNCLVKIQWKTSYLLNWAKAQTLEFKVKWLRDLLLFVPIPLYIDAFFKDNPENSEYLISAPQSTQKMNMTIWCLPIIND